MNVKRLILHNFLSHKEVDIDLSKEGIYNIIGKTGAGKSAIRDALTYTLFGKGRYDDQEKYISDYEKEMFVVVEFEQNEKTFRVTRKKVKGETTKLEVEELNEIRK